MLYKFIIDLFFTKYIGMIKIRMNNCRLANLDEVVQKEKGRANRMI